MATLGSLPETYYSIDVECVATGRRHDERGVALVAVVDKNERLILRKKVKIDRSKVVSYLTPLTGIRPGDLDNGESLDSVIRQVKSLLGPNVVLVGQGIANDIKWLNLREGVDYNYSVDLGQFFKVYNPRYSNYSYFNLQHEANILLGPGTLTGDEHDPGRDAAVSIRLFNKYYANPRLKEQDAKRLLQTRPQPSWAKRNNYQWEGVCMASYMPRLCICGAPTLHNDY
jgi:RNA exonuclease 4